jgi:AraC-like DNA-binding protein
VTIAPHTARFPAVQSFEEWQDAVSSAFVPLNATTENEDRFSGVQTSQPLGAVQLSPSVRVRSRWPAPCMRSGRRIPNTTSWACSGAATASSPKIAGKLSLTPGDFALYDTSRPCSLSFGDDFRMLVVMFPRTLLRVKPQHTAALTARWISGRQGLGAVASPFLLRLGEGLESEQVTASSELADAVLDLLAATLAEQLDEPGHAPAGSYRQALLLQVQVKSFIDARLGDPELRSSTIASAHYISVRYLQKLFEAEGTTATEWMRSGDWNDADASWQTQTSTRSRSASFRDAGLVDASHFSRMFKLTYGPTSREYRRTWPSAMLSTPHD